MAAGVERLGPRLWRAFGRDGRAYLLRPLQPSDAPAMQRAWEKVSPEDRQMRALRALPRIPDRLALALCSPDESRDVALVFTPENDPSALVGGARLMRDPTGTAGEYAVSVVSALHGQGLGRKALETALELGREIGTTEAWGLVSRKNQAMRALAAKLGMTEAPCPDDPGMVLTRLKL